MSPSADKTLKQSQPCTARYNKLRPSSAVQAVGHDEITEEQRKTSSYCLISSGMLHGGGWYIVTDVSEKLIGPICKRQTVQASWTAGPTPHNIPEERSLQNTGGSLKSRSFHAH